jgi:hypothetical protein
MEVFLVVKTSIEGLKEYPYGEFPFCFPQCLHSIMMRHPLFKLLSHNPVLCWGGKNLWAGITHFEFGGIEYELGNEKGVLAQVT